MVHTDAVYINGACCVSVTYADAVFMGEHECVITARANAV